MCRDKFSKNHVNPFRFPPKLWQRQVVGIDTMVKKNWYSLICNDDFCCRGTGTTRSLGNSGDVCRR